MHTWMEWWVLLTSKNTVKLKLAILSSCRNFRRNTVRMFKRIVQLRYRIAGNFRGRKPLWILRFYNYPWKFSPRNFSHATAIHGSFLLYNSGCLHQRVYTDLQILDTFKDWEFFYGESGMDGGGMVALMNYREDGITPYMLFFKDGVVEEKVVSACFTTISCDQKPKGRLSIMHFLDVVHMYQYNSLHSGFAFVL